jgi:hypothetical protein
MTSWSFQLGFGMSTGMPFSIQNLPLEIISRYLPLSRTCSHCYLLDINKRCHSWYDVIKYREIFM